MKLAINLNDEKTKTMFLSEKPYNLSSYPKEGLLSMFANIVQKYPQHIAVEQVNSIEESPTYITYLQINERSNGIASALIKLGTTINQIILVHINNVTDLSCCIWGVIKSGCAYCIVDPAVQEDSLREIMKKVQPVAVITDKPERFTTTVPIIIFNNLYMLHENPLDFQPKPEHLLYSILTSGISAQPKVVLVQHQGVLNTIDWRLKTYEYSSETVTFSFLNPSFDAFGADFFSSMLSGGRLICIRHDVMRNYQVGLSVIKNYAITNLSITPTNMYNLLLMDTKLFPLVKNVILGGERISDNLLSICFHRFPNSRIFNEYGPTENSIITSSKQLVPGVSSDNIGQEIPNTHIFLIKDGVVSQEGEMYISGAGIAQGYLNDPQENDASFFEHPYLDGQSIYKTGDLAYLDDLGDYHFTGRIDRTVKVHGHTIDLDQLERCVIQLDLVAHAAAQLHVNEKTQHPQIDLVVGGIQQETNLDLHEIMQHISKIYPYFGSSIQIRQTNQFSVTSHQKADGKVTEFRNSSYHDQILQSVTLLWENILDKSDIDPDINFFDLGGNSLKMMDMYFELAQEYHNKIELIDIFNNCTINKLTDFLMKK